MVEPLISTKDRPIKKIGLYADPHLSQNSSIIVGKKGEFTGRLDNLIKSFTWMNKVFNEKQVDAIVCLGDLTDKPDLTALEITALSKCNIDHHYLIIGNHCRADKDGKLNSLANYNYILNEPQILVKDENDNPLVYVLPYNSDKVDLSGLNHPKVILSHNDIEGYSFGNGITSKTGYNLSELIDNCDLYINGHLHNGGWVVKDKILNLGMLSGSNFASTSYEWNPSIGILDLDTLKVELIENPEAFKFKKVEFDSLPKIKNYIDSLKGEHYVIQIKVPSRLAESIRKLIDQTSKIDYSRILVSIDNADETNDSTESTKNVEIGTNITIYNKLREFIKSQKKSSKFNQDIVFELINELETINKGDL